MNRISARFQTGETIVLGLQLIKGSMSNSSSPVAKAKLAGANLTVPADNAAVAFTFTVTERAATADLAAGYDLVGGPVSTAGIYCANLQYSSGGNALKTSHIFFSVEASAT